MKRNLMVTLALSTVLLGACGGNKHMMDINGQLSALKADNTSAMDKATEALNAANGAKADAAQALSTANAAKAQSDDTDTKLNSMFKKAMYK